MPKDFEFEKIISNTFVPTIYLKQAHNAVTCM